jgi:ketosteroid isomerase-like protein
MKPARLAAACAFAATIHMTAASASDDAAAVQDAIKENYAAYSSFDADRYRATTTDDFVLLENGEFIDRETDAANMAKPGTGFRRTDHFDFKVVKVAGDTAYAAYVLKSDIYDDAQGARSREWLESAFLRREGSRWKMALLHSTRVLHPAGAADMKQFAVRYTAAWCSQDPLRVAAFFSEHGSLTINGGAPSIGRAAITETARSFMTGFPDLVVEMDGLEYQDGRYRFRWTLTGTNTGPGGSGRKVRISGYEEWTIGADGLIAESQGRYDQADWDRQVGKPGSEST